MQKTLSVVSLQAIQSNLRLIRMLTPNKKVWAVVKANAYGHGAIPVAHAIEREVDGFCVAILSEGVELRVSGIQKPILVFTPPQTQAEVNRMGYYGLTATVNSEHTAKLIGELPCHIKVNTGMNRYGCQLSALKGICKTLNPTNIHGVYSHLYCPQNKAVAQSQLILFLKAEQTVKAFAPNAVAHLAASGGILLGKEYLLGGVRAGILLYGYAPDMGEVNTDNNANYSYTEILQGLKPALQVFAHRTQQTECVGRGAGYGFQTKPTRYMATYRLGYADGFWRNVPLGEGNLCMDAFVGEDRGEWLPVFTNAQTYAKRAGTICYEVLCKATMRSHIVYV
jgi:alanine racemase